MKCKDIVLLYFDSCFLQYIMYVYSITYQVYVHGGLSPYENIFQDIKLQSHSIDYC